MRILKLKETKQISGGFGPEALKGLEALPMYIGIGLMASFALGITCYAGLQYFFFNK